jgi:LmeA-like phospholipid-binding
VRGCLFVLIFAAVVLAAGAWLAGPALAAFAVRNALQSAGFAAGSIDVAVTADPPLTLLTGRADSVEITATDASIDRLAASRLDVRLDAVDLFARSFGAVDGRLTDVAVPTGAGSAVTAAAVELHGPASAIAATVHIARATAELLFRDELARVTGRAVADVRLAAPDQVTFSIGPVSASATLVATGGDLVLEANVPGRPSGTLLHAGDPLVIRSVAIGDELVIVGTMNGSDWLTPQPSP